MSQRQTRTLGARWACITSYHDLGAGYYEQRMHARRQARNHVRSLERLGYQVTIQAINPDTGEFLPAAG